MANFSKDSGRPRVLILDTEATPIARTNKMLKSVYAFAFRLGCHVEFVTYTTTLAGDQVYRDGWDLIVIPYVSGNSSSYTNVANALSYFHDATIPVFIQSCQTPSVGTGQALTGMTATDATTGEVVSTSFTNWESRTTGDVAFYGQFPTVAGMNTSIATPIASTSTLVLMWKTTVSSHPVLWIGGYSSSNGKINKPWYGFQWMVDQQSTTAKKDAVRRKLRPAYLLLRWDGLDDANMNTARSAGDLDTVYNLWRITYEVKEIWLATIFDHTNGPGGTDATTADWFLDRAENNGGLFRVMNHATDVVNGANTYAGNAEACTSDGTSFDQFIQSGRVYEYDCGRLVSYGFTLGSDNLGKGYPNVQDGNDMNNPAALFLAGDGYRVWDGTDGQFYGGYGCHLWLSPSEDYPTSGETPTTTKTYSHNWNGGQTLVGFSCDAIDPSTATHRAITLNGYVLDALIWGGGLYWHGTGIQLMADGYEDEVGQLYTTCPDVIKSGPWEDMLVELKRGSGIWFET